MEQKIFIGQVTKGKFSKDDKINHVFRKNEGKELAVLIQEPKDIRTLQQNRYLHKIITIIGEHFGYRVDEMKLLLKDHFSYFEEFTNKKTGEVMKKYKSTADMSKKDLSDFTERIIQFAAEHGVMILTPEEYFEKY